MKSRHHILTSMRSVVQSASTRKSVLWWLKAILIVLLLECTLWNIPFWQSRFYSENTPTFSYGDGFRQISTLDQCTNAALAHNGNTQIPHDTGDNSVIHNNFNDAARYDRQPLPLQVTDSSSKLSQQNQQTQPEITNNSPAQTTDSADENRPKTDAEIQTLQSQCANDFTHFYLLGHANTYIEITNLHESFHNVALPVPQNSADPSQLVQSGLIRDGELQVPTAYTVKVDILPEGSNEWIGGSPETYTTLVPQTMILHNHTGYQGTIQAMRIWWDAPEYTLVQLQNNNVRVNTPIPFNYSWLRVSLMALLALIIFLIRPRSALYLLPLQLDNRKQIAGFTALTCIPLMLIVYFMRMDWRTGGDPIFASPNSYTYDFGQYNHLASALAQGHAWLDMPVPEALQHIHNPWSFAERNALIEQGTENVYWDYAYHNGHWYSYFGVLPAITIFLPWQLLMRLLHSDRVLPTPTVTLFLLGVSLVCLVLLVLRVLRRYYPQVSVGVTIIALFTTVIASNWGFLVFRPNMYVTPVAYSLMLTFAGLWLWLGSRRIVVSRSNNPHRKPTKIRSRCWYTDDPPFLDNLGTTTYYSRWRLAIGTLLMAANISSRPNFILCMLLALPIFWEDIRYGSFLRWLQPHYWNSGKAHNSTLSARTTSLSSDMNPNLYRTQLWQRYRMKSALLNDVLIIVVTVLPIAAQCAYNTLRFGSPLNWGNNYQFTVVDLTHYHMPLHMVPEILWYYLFQPMNISAVFPYINLTDISLSQWQYVEAGIGGIFMMFPMLCCIALWRIVPKQHIQRNGLTVSRSCIALGLLLAALVGLKGGFTWRYIADFSVLFALAAVMGIAQFETSWRRALAHNSFNETPHSTSVGADSSADSSANVHQMLVRTYRWIMNIIIVLCIIQIIIAFFENFTNGRHDSLQTINPTLWYTVQSWFNFFG